MKRKFSKILGIGLTLALLASLLLTATPVVAAESEVWVDDDFTEATEGWGVTHFATIQEGIDAVDPLGTVNVAAGTYDEQVVIGKSLTLQGAGDTTIIQPPAEELTATSDVPWIGGGTGTMSAIVSVETTGSTVIIKNLKIDGSLIPTKSTTWVAGLVYLETSGKVEGVTVIGNPTLPDRTAGIFAAAISESASLEVTGCTVEFYNRAGIYALGEAMTADYHHNEINGPGPISTGVPNGMFFLRGATGSATYNTITDLGYTGETYRATGIGTYDAGTGITFGHNTISNVQNAFCLNRGSDVTVEYNTVYDCHTGVRLESGTADNIIQYNSIKDNTYAIRSSPSGGDNVAHFNSFVGNEGTGMTGYEGAVSNVDTTNTLDATYNWWGDCSGPSGVGPGIGDSVSDYVDYDPWWCSLVDIDIKPGSDPNSINLKSKGVVPVAVLTTDGFDVSTVDPYTVEFAGTSPVRWVMCDVDDDSDIDMLFHFKTQELVDLDENSTEATLTGATNFGMPIEGTDVVNIVPTKKGK